MRKEFGNVMDQKRSEFQDAIVRESVAATERIMQGVQVRISGMLDGLKNDFRDLKNRMQQQEKDIRDLRRGMMDVASEAFSPPPPQPMVTTPTTSRRTPRNEQDLARMLTGGPPVVMATPGSRSKRHAPPEEIDDLQYETRPRKRPAIEPVRDRCTFRLKDCCQDFVGEAASG
ncbi:uncharacterized protein P884DRAFT_303961 [Thermothelomyces heterothallicus CBS 202.75]|uniref:uncharacterized protein n=1 Tax=Thermothelomyces heterothallicus CBS 202.75 TaxID=1149848 RepID=UPI003742ECF6